MKISEALTILKQEQTLKRSPSGRSLTEYAIDCVIATLDDEKNWDNDIAQCINCNFVGSLLLMPEGCPNCNSKDLDMDVNLNV